MAKSRRNRGGTAHRRDPTAKPVKPPADPDLAALREAKILPAVRLLRDADPKARAAAAAAVANIATDPRCRKLLLRERIVHTLLTQTLSDAALESRAAGWGILQLLAREEEADFAIHLFRQDILTAAQFAAQRILDKICVAGSSAPHAATTSSSSSSSSFNNIPKAERAFVASIAASLVSLLTALADASDEALEAICANPALIRLLATLVAHNPESDHDALADLRTDALACLMVLCEDNAPLAAGLATPDGRRCFDALMAIKDLVNADGVLACATLHNIFASLASSDDARALLGADDSALIPTLVSVLDEASTTDHGDKVGWSAPSEQQRLALETLAAIGTSLSESLPSTDNDAEPPSRKAQRPEANGDDDDDDDHNDQDMMDADDPAAENGDAKIDDDDENDDDDEMADEEIMADLEMVTAGDADDADDIVRDIPVFKSLIDSAIPRIVHLTKKPTTSTNDTAAAAAEIRDRALVALNNIAWSVSLFDFSDDRNAVIQRLWQPVARALWKSQVSAVLSGDAVEEEEEEEEEKLVPRVLALAWALARALGGRVLLAHDEHRRFMTMYEASLRNGDATTTKNNTQNGHKDDEDDDKDPFRSTSVMLIGILGQLALHPCPLETNREIGHFLLTIITTTTTNTNTSNTSSSSNSNNKNKNNKNNTNLPTPTPATTIEAINQLLDIYADEASPCDAAVFWAHDFLTPLEKNALPRARAMVKGIDRAAGEVRARAIEAVVNLERFVAYKKKHRP